MAIKKTQLYSSLWQSCDELRGGMDASQYKNYVLTLLFMKYVSDKYGGDRYGLIVVPEKGSFEDMVALQGDKEIGDKINKIIRTLAEANNLRGVIDQADFNDEDKLGRGKEMVDRLSKLVAIFAGLDLSANRAEGDDLLGDAYEYLMRHFATESGKSKGQFYTPAEVSRVMAQVLEIPPDAPPATTVYDPTCGSGSLLIKVTEESPRGLSIYGQEMDNSTWALARMNMFLHGYPTHEIWRGNTLAAPHWTNEAGQLKTFDFGVANPPFSYKSWQNGLNPAEDEYDRFEYGAPPAKNGDYAFLLHLLKSLNSTGRAAIILPHGVLFRGHAEASIRRTLVRQGVIKGIIGLPPNLFYGTGIPACIIVLDKAEAAQRRSLFMVDASRGFMKDGNKNRLRSRDIHKIVDVFTRLIEQPGYARRVSLTEIEENDYNLNIPRYIDSSDPEDRHDLSAHLHGGIPLADIDALDNFWAVFPTLRRALFQANSRPGYSELQVESGQIKETILKHPEFVAFTEQTLNRFEAWWAAHSERLYGLSAGIAPKALIADLAEDLLDRFSPVELLDEYAIYQRLMDYWAETMQDDLYLIAQAGWETGRTVRPAEEGETPDFSFKKGRKTVGYVGDLIPADLLIARFYPQQRQEVAARQAAIDEAAARKEALEEEHTGDEGLMEELKGSRGVSKTSVVDRVIELRDAILAKYPPDSAEYQQADAIIRNFTKYPWPTGVTDADDYFAELDLLYAYLTAYDDERAAKKRHKKAEAELYKRAIETYQTLTVPQIQQLVIEDKWRTTLHAEIEAEIERVTQRLTGRMQELAERYADPLPDLIARADALAARVDDHLAQIVSADQPERIR